MINQHEDNKFNYTSSRFSLNEEEIYTFLSKVLEAKIMIDKGEDMYILLKESIDTFSYPFNLYLMAKNEAKNHREEQAKFFAQKVLDHLSTYSLIFCAGLRKEMKSIIDPNFDETLEPILKTENNIPIGKCLKDKAKEISINIHNQGEKTLTIYDVRNSCDCIDIHWDTLSIPKNQTKPLKIRLTPKNIGFIEETIYIFSNAQNSMVLSTLTGVTK